MKKPKSRLLGWVKFFVVLTAITGVVAVVGQTCHSVIRVGHDDYMLMPISEWGFGSGYWDGFNAPGKALAGASSVTVS